MTELQYTAVIHEEVLDLLLAEANAKVETLRTALEAAPPVPDMQSDDELLIFPGAYRCWYNGQRQEVLGVVNVGQMSGEPGHLRDEDVTMAIYAADQELCDDD